MYYLIFYDFTEDVQKVSLARLLKKERNLSLTNAKNAVDNLMEGIPVGFLFTEKNLLEQLQKGASLMGVKSKTIDSVFIPKIAQRRRSISRTSKPTGDKKQKEFSKALIY